MKSLRYIMLLILTRMIETRCPLLVNVPEYNLGLYFNILLDQLYSGEYRQKYLSYKSLFGFHLYSWKISYVFSTVHSVLSC